MEATKPDVTLSDGREIVFDLNRISIREYRALFDREQSEGDEYATLAKAAGMTADEVGALGYEDWRRFGQAFFKKAREPLADPN